MKEGNRFPLFLITPNGDFIMYSVKQQESINAFRTYVRGDTFTRAEYQAFRKQASDLGVIAP